MELQDFEIEDLDDEDEEDDDLLIKSKGSSGARGGAMKVFLIIGINLFVILLVVVILGIVALVKGRITIVGADSANSADRPMYTEAEMENLVSAAKAEAQAAEDSEIENAYNNGYSIGSNFILDYLKNTLMSTNSSLQTFNTLYPDHIVVVSGGRYNFLPINRELAQSQLVQDQLAVLDNGEFTYLDVSGNIISHKGIDVSEYQGNINWSKVADDGVEFAIMRAYYRGYGTGRLVKDSMVETNIQGAIDNGIHVGVYVFSQAINKEEAVEEAQSAIDILAPYATNVPIIIDIEHVAGASPRMDALSVDERTDVVLSFCDTVLNAGYIPMIYYNTEMGALGVDLTRLEGIAKWYAWYGEWLYLPYEFDIWQYRDSGKVNGISGNVDMNIALKAFW